MITTKDGKQYVFAALENARQFLKDAKILINNGSYAHGAALAVLAIEEGSKAKMATQYIMGNSELRVDAKKYQKEIKNHLSKLSLAANDYYLDELTNRLISPEEKCSFQELYQRVKQAEKDKEFIDNLEIESLLFKCLTTLKEKWLYVDIEKEKVTSPLKWSKEDSERVLQMAKNKLQGYEKQIKHRMKETH